MFDQKFEVKNRHKCYLLICCQRVD